MKKLIIIFLLFLFLINLGVAQVQTTHGLLKDKIYSWDQTGFMVNTTAVYLPGGQRLVENPQIADVDNDAQLDILIYATDGHKFYLFKTVFNGGNFVLPSQAESIDPQQKSIYEHYQDIAVAQNIKQPQLNYSSVLGRLPVFQLEPGKIKKYGDLYHFGEDRAAPQLIVHKYTEVFSPNDDGFKDEANFEYKFTDDRAAYAIDVYAEVIAQDTGEIVYSSLEQDYALISITHNVTWNGLAGSGITANEGFYYLRLSGTDEAGNNIYALSTPFYLKVTSPQIKIFTYIIQNTNYPQIVMNKSTKTIFNINWQDEITSVNQTDYEITITKQEDPDFKQVVYGRANSLQLYRDWFMQDEFTLPLPDGYYTAECKIIDSVNLISDPVTVAIEINREPIKAEIIKEHSIFTPHNTEDTFPDVANFDIVLTDRGITVNVPYSYQIFSDLGQIIITQNNYSGSQINWNGKDANGNFVADGAYILKVKTADEIGNTYEAIDQIINTKIPVKITAPKNYISAANMVPIVGTVIDPGGTTFMDFDSFDIYVRAGEHSDFGLPENNYLNPDPAYWQVIKPLPYFMSPADSNFPNSNFGVRPGYGAKLAFWQPEISGTYTLLLRVKDKENYVQVSSRVVEVDLSGQQVNVDLITPQENSVHNINNDDFILITDWNTSAFNNLFSYEVNIYQVSENKKVKMVKNFSKRGNVPEASTKILWDGKNQWNSFVENSNYCLEIYFYDLNHNIFTKKEVNVQINNFYDDPLVIEKYNLVNNESIFLQISEPASYNIAIYAGSNLVHEISDIYNSGVIEKTIPPLEPGFYRLNITAEAVGNPQDFSEASLTLVLNQDLVQNGSELIEPTANIEPRHYFAFEAQREGVFYPEVTGSIKLKLSGMCEIYPYDPYTLGVTYKAAEAFWTYSDDYTHSYADSEDGRADEGCLSFSTNFLQDVYIETGSDTDGDVNRKWYGLTGGIRRWEAINFEHEYRAESSKGGYCYMYADAYYKNRQIHYDQKNIYWKNKIDYVKIYENQPAYETLNQDLIPMLDKYYLLRGKKKNILLDFKSARPDYEKDIEVTYWHDRYYLVYPFFFGIFSGLEPGEPKEVHERRYLWHHGITKFHHEFNIMRQVEYDEEEFIKTSVLEDDYAKYFDNDYNYINVNILADNFAEPQKEPFEFELEIPLKDLYKGNDFKSGNLAEYVNAALGEETQFIQIPYQVVSGDVTVNRYFPVELPISVNTKVYAAEIVSSVDSRINAYINHEPGYPQLYASTDYAVPWNSNQDPNLSAGKIKAIAVYDPINNSRIVLSDYYPKSAVNRQQSMFLIENGQIKSNPQVKLAGNWNINLKDVRDKNVTHQALSISEVLYSQLDSVRDYFEVNLDHKQFIEAYYPVLGYLAKGYKENGYSIFIRSADSSTWQEDSTYTEMFDPDYQFKSSQAGSLLGFVKISNRNKENTIKLLSSGYKGTSEALASILIGKQINKGEQSRVYAYDYRSWLDIYADSLITQNAEYITLTPQKFDRNELELPENIEDPFGPVYNMQPNGLKFNAASKPILTSLLNNASSENIDLTRLVAYHLNSQNQLKIMPIYAIADADKDQILQPSEQGYISSLVEGFSRQFYVPSLGKLHFASYKIYSNSEMVTLNARGQPTGNLEGFLYQDYSMAVVDQKPDTASGDYVINLNLTPGQHIFEAREYQLVDNYKNVGPMSDPVEIVVDLDNPSLSQTKISNTIVGPSKNNLSFEYLASEKGKLVVAVSDNIQQFPAASGLNQQAIKLESLLDGEYTAQFILEDASGRQSNLVTASITYDSTAPQNGALQYPEAGQIVPQALTVNYLVPTDEVSGLKLFELEYEVNNSWQKLTALEVSLNNKQVYLLAGAT